MPTCTSSAEHPDLDRLRTGDGDEIFRFSLETGSMCTVGRAPVQDDQNAVEQRFECLSDFRDPRIVGCELGKCLVGHYILQSRLFQWFQISVIRQSVRVVVCFKLHPVVLVIIINMIILVGEQVIHKLVVRVRLLLSLSQNCLGCQRRLRCYLNRSECCLDWRDESE